jgi:hypothetical protein
MHQQIRTLLFCILCVIVSGVAFGQAYKDSIRSQFQEYSELLIKKDFQASLRYINPEFLKIVPGTQLVAAMEKVMNNPDVELKVDEMKVVSIGDTHSINGKHYVQLRYSTNMSMRMMQSGDTAAIKEGLAAQFGKENVKYDAATSFYQLRMFKNVVADSQDGKHWTFVVAEDRQRSILEKFIPRELLNFSK